MNIPTIDPQRALELGDPIQCPQCGQPLARRVTTNLKYETIKLWCNGLDCMFKQVIRVPRDRAEQAYTVSVTIRPPATEQTASTDDDARAQSPTWPHVLAFAKRMEGQLQSDRNDPNRFVFGTPDQWRAMHPGTLISYAVGEIAGIGRCHRTGMGHGAMPHAARAVVALMQAADAMCSATLDADVKRMKGER